MLSFRDKSGRIIRLTEERIKHIYKHPEMQNKLDLVEKTITNSDYVEEDLYRRKILYYYRYIKEEKKYVMVTVKLTNSHGYILTAYLTEK